MEEKILLIGKLIQEGIEGEAEALKDYNRKLAEIYALDAETGDKCAPVIAEIISDELNHIAKLTALYTELTGIAENKE